MKLICIIVLVFVLAIIAASLLLNRIMFQTVKTVNRSNCHEQYADENLQISFKSGRNLLHGYLYGAKNKTGLVIISSGMGVTSDYYIPEARWLAKHGYMVMAFDNTAYRNNSGCFRGILQAVYDLKAAILYAEQYGLPITLFGHSMGGYAVCAVLNYADVAVDKVISVAGFATIREILHSYAVANVKKFSFLVEFFIQVAQFIWFGKMNKLSAIDGINQSCSEVVIAQGKNDEEVSCDTVSIFSKQEALRKSNIRYLLFEHGIYSTHMGIIRDDTDKIINEDLLKSIQDPPAAPAIQ